jgi:mannose-1-phosphate guanylyltransferase
VLLGAEPTYAEVEYGLIEPAADPLVIDGEAVFGIRRFWEKPSAVLAERLLARGCLWTMMATLVVRCSNCAPPRR